MRLSLRVPFLTQLFTLILTLAAIASPARAQVTITSSSRVAGLSTAAGNANASNSTTGAWTPTLNVAGDSSFANIDSEVSPGNIALSLNWSSTSNPGGALPGGVVQMQVQFSVAAATQLNFSRSNTGPASTALSINDQFGGTVVSPGQPDGSVPINGGTYTLTYFVTCPPLNSGSNSFAVTFGQPPAPAPGQFAFTYQGRLNFDGTSPPTRVDVQYAFFTTATGTTQTPGLSGGQINSVARPADGLVNLLINPGAPFPAELVYLELRVRPEGGGPFTTLSPRTPITPTPKATFANTAALATTATNATNAVNATTAQNALGLTANGRIVLAGDVTSPSQTPGLWLRSPGLTGGDYAFMGLRDEFHAGLYANLAGWTFVQAVDTGNIGIGRAYASNLTPNFDLELRGLTDTQLAITGAPSGRTWSLQSSAGNYGAGSQLNGSFQIIDRNLNAARVLIDSNGNMGVGTVTPQQRLDVAGNVRTSRVIYSTPVTSHVSIGDAAWRPRNGTTNVVNLSVGNGGVSFTPGDLAGAVAELQLPHGATIQFITSAFTDNDTNQDLNFALQVNNFSTYTSVINLGGSTGASPSGRTSGTNAAAGVVIDNLNNYYQIRCIPVGNPFGQWTSNLAIRGVIVTYTLPGPAH